MFKSLNRDADGLGAAVMPAAGGKRGMFSLLGPDVTVTGNIAATADLHIDGRVEGDVACGALVQGAESTIVGSVTAENARLAGTVEGAVRARELHVERSAQITGDVEYESITIETGARVEGSLKHRSAAAPSTTVTNVTRITDAVVAEPKLIA